MFVVPYVCAEFHDKHGIIIGRIVSADLQKYTELPDSIRQDPLYDMLLGDGSIVLPETKAELKQLENDPERKPARSVKTGKAEKSAKAEPANPAEAPEAKEAEASDAKGGTK